MSVEEEITFIYYKSQIETLLEDGNMIESFSNFGFEPDNAESHIESMTGLPTIQSMEENFNKQSLNRIITILKDLKSERSIELVKNLEEPNFTWNRLVQHVKNKRKEDILQTDSYSNMNLSEMNNTIELFKLADKDKIHDVNCINYSNFHELFNKGFNKILVQGDPGIGKTIQIRSLISSWYNDEWNENLNTLVLLISLDYIQPFVDIIDVILKQNFLNIPYINRRIVELLLTEKSKNVLLFIDGAEKLRVVSKSIDDILEKANCPVQTVIWSNKRRAKQIADTCDVIFELNGLNLNQLDKLLNHYYKNKDSLIADFTKAISQQNSQIITDLCKIPEFSLNLFQVWMKDMILFTKNTFEILEEIINTSQNGKVYSIKFSKSSTKLIEKSCFKMLTKDKLTLSTRSIDKRIILNYFKGLAHIDIESDINFGQVTFLHQSIKEYFASKFLIRTLENFNLCCLRNRDVYLDLLFENDYSTSFNILNFIRQYSRQLFQDIVYRSEKFQIFSKFSNNFMNLIDKELKDKTLLQLQDEWLNDAAVSILFEKKGMYLNEIIFKNIQLNLNTIIQTISRHCPSLRNLYLDNQGDNNNNNGNRTISMEHIITLIKSIPIENISLDGTFFEIIKTNVQSSLSNKLYISDLRMINESHSKKVIIYVTFGSIYMKTFIDECRNYSLFRINNWLNFLETCQSINSFILKHKTITKRIYEQLLDLFIKWKECNITPDVNLENFSIELNNEDLYNNVDSKGINDDYLNEKTLPFNDMELNICSTVQILQFSRINKDIIQHLIQNNPYISSLEFNGLFYMLNQHLVGQRNLRIEEFLFGHRPIKFLKDYLINRSIVEKLSFEKTNFCNHFLKNEIIEQTTIFKHLKILEINDCNLSQNQATLIGYCLQLCRHIETLSLQSNSRMDKGFIDICNGLERVKTSIKNLNFDFCYLNESQSRHLGNCLLTGLNIEDLSLKANQNMNKAFNTICEGLMKSVCTLKRLNLDDCYLKDNDLVQFKELSLMLSNIEILSLKGNRGMKNSLDNICTGLTKSSSTLKSLNMAHWNLNCDESKKLAKCLGDCLTLEALSVEGNEHMKYGLNVLSNNVKNSCSFIKCLNFDNCNLTEVQVVSLAECLAVCSDIVELSFKGNKNILNGFIKVSTRMSISLPNLQILYLDNCSLIDRQLEYLGKLLVTSSNIEILSLAGNKGMKNGFNHICEGLKRSVSKIKHLNFDDCALTKVDLVSLSELLSLCSQVEILSLSLNKGMKDEFNTILTELNRSIEQLKKLFFNECDIDESQAKALANSLQISSKISTLSLKRNPNMGVGFYNLCKGLGSSSYNIIDVYLDECNLDESQAISFGNCLRFCSNLKVLSLNGNEHMKGGFKSICTGLQSSRNCFKVIYLEYCNLNGNQVKCFGEFLKVCSYVQLLSMKGNENIGEGFADICEGIINSANCLKSLNFDDCSLNEHQAKYLEESLNVLHYIESFSIRGNNEIGRKFKAISKSFEISRRQETNANGNSYPISQEQVISVGEIDQTLSNI
ncbi:unnamed protein product [Dimorphilus gyrociliatus]|uniref:NACHT domain-containing protein n=1 Tax=Dimorphilus gyrociliatus TaxID=2664684 RepID=A0A7I8W2C1_9ANNE|nr:unnamed protein product [Dimorphilus gyrociliatus]